MIVIDVLSPILGPIIWALIVVPVLLKTSEMDLVVSVTVHRLVLKVKVEFILYPYFTSWLLTLAGGLFEDN